MTERTVLDRLTDDLAVGSAPISELLSEGRRAKRRKRRHLLTGSAAATTLVLGGGLISHVLTSEGAGDGSSASAPGSSHLDVLVQSGVSPDVAGWFATPGTKGAALWRPEDQALIYVSGLNYSTTCPPEATVHASGGTVTVAVRKGQHAGVCTADAGPATVTIDGLTAPPTELTVTDAGDTSKVRVETALGIVPPLRASRSLPVGATGELTLGVHCGLRYATIDGEAWETTPRGGPSAPRGWPEVVKGIATRIEANTVIYSSPRVVDRLVFHPAEQPNDHFVCQ